ncbi:MAG TPA: Kiwa anti-phage protein KwaB-like domain-containing protein [Candidatus Saccharimonadales bacterium]|nr:Kiwa anti-phage protein KwaB-like domain-containing protein [Candidatus Saccharimonadales bacterium]
MIFAKMKSEGRNLPQYRLIASGESELRDFTFYSFPNIHLSTKFDPEKVLEGGQWFYVTLSDEQRESMISPYIGNEESSGDLNHTVESDYGSVEVIYRVDAGKAVFTKITDSYRIANKRILKFFDSERAQVFTEENSVEFSGEPHAFYDGAGILYFRSFKTIRSLFPGVEEFFRRATESEKQKFLDCAVFDNQGVSPDSIGQIDSRRIATILQDESVDIENTSQHQKIINAVGKYADYLGITIVNNKIVLKDKKDVTKVVKALLSRYYTSEITGLRMESYGSAKIS